MICIMNSVKASNHLRKFLLTKTGIHHGDTLATKLKRNSTLEARLKS